MKSKNSPLKKALRRARAQGYTLTEAQIEALLAIRTKKNRSK